MKPPTPEKISVFRGDDEDTVSLPLEDYPALLQFPLFKPPAFLTGESYEKGITLYGVDTISFGPSPEEMAKKLGVTRIKFTQNYRHIEFARMIAKIAYGFSIAELGMRKLDDIFVLPAIRGEKDDIGRWVGIVDDTPQPSVKMLHHLKLLEDRDRGLLLGDVRLFSDSQTPTYRVVLRPL